MISYGMKPKLLIVALIILFLCLPFLIVQFIPTTNPEPYIFKAAVIEKLGETLQGKLRYYLVEEIKGITPASPFVVTIDSAYARGDLREFEKNQQAWMQGNIMTKDVFFGEQYLFFGYHQLYISQIKNGIFWPDQITELRTLYISPLTAFSSLLFLFWYPFMEEFSPDNYFVMVVQSFIIVATIVPMVKKRYTGRSLALVLLIYGIIMIITTIPLLSDLC
jgi:hypothetical protein